MVNTEILKEIPVDPGDLEKALAYLKAFNYLRENFDLGDLFRAIKAFQEYFDLESDGILGPKTLRAMSYMRCGCSDVENLIESATRYGWNKKRITYSVHSFVDGLSQETQEQLIINAWESWEAVADLQIVYVGRNKSADVTIRASGRGNGLGTSGNVLAYAGVQVGGSTPLELVMDLAETWIDNPSKRGILYVNVMAHELGHILGLVHSNKSGALMAPYYSPGVAKPQQNDDITRIQAIYGPSKQVPVPSDPKPIPSDKIIIEVTGKINIPGYRLTRI